MYDQIHTLVNLEGVGSYSTLQVILSTGPLCTTKHTYLANRILLGIFGSPVESLCEVSITDIVRITWVLLPNG